MSRLLAMFPLFRWWRTLLALKHGARVHPQARLLGSRSQIVLGSGCKIGARVCIDPGRSGRVSIGERVWVAADVEMQTDSEIKIREGASIQRRSTINGSTVLGRDCILAPGVFISSGTHPFRAIPHLHIREQERLLSRKATERFALDRPIWVQDDCWLGTNVVVCPGVTIGKGSVVGANSVVTHDVAPYSVVAGCPARLIARRLEWVPPSSLNPARDLDHPYLLDARLRDDARGIFIEVNATDPLLAALSLPRENTRIQISWRATQDLAVIAGERKLSLPSGEGKLEIQAGDLNIAHNIALCALKLASDNPSGVCLDILGIQCI